MSADVRDESRNHARWVRERDLATAETLVRSLGKKGAGVSVTDELGHEYKIFYRRVETENCLSYYASIGPPGRVPADHRMSRLVPVLKIDGQEVPEAGLEKHREFLLAWAISINAPDPDSSVIDTLHQQAVLQAA